MTSAEIYYLDEPVVRLSVSRHFGDIVYEPESDLSVMLYLEDLSKKVNLSGADFVKALPSLISERFTVVELDKAVTDAEDPDTATLIAEAAKAPLAKSVDDWINILDKWVKQFDSLEEADAQLAEAYDQLKDKNFTKTLEQYNMLAHLAGMAEIIDEDTEDDK